MADILPFKRPTPKTLATKKKKSTGKRNTLCKNNHHKWDVIKSQKFDVKQGKLVTVEQCQRCGIQRNRLT